VSPRNEPFCQVKWLTSVIPALRRLRQEDQELEVNLSYTVLSQTKSHTYKQKNRSKRNDFFRSPGIKLQVLL
jgi:hypothetical protein